MRIFPYYSFPKIKTIKCTNILLFFLAGLTTLASDGPTLVELLLKDGKGGQVSCEGDPLSASARFIFSHPDGAEGWERHLFSTSDLRIFAIQTRGSHLIISGHFSDRLDLGEITLETTTPHTQFSLILDLKTGEIISIWQRPKARIATEPNMPLTYGFPTESGFSFGNWPLNAPMKAAPNDRSMGLITDTDGSDANPGGHGGDPGGSNSGGSGG